MIKETWYLLYDGSSEDGGGYPDYKGRTLDKEKAKKWYLKCKNNPYSNGHVLIITNKEEHQADPWTNWEKL